MGPFNSTPSVFRPGKQGVVHTLHARLLSQQSPHDCVCVEIRLLVCNYDSMICLIRVNFVFPLSSIQNELDSYNEVSTKLNEAKETENRKCLKGKMREDE